MNFIILLLIHYVYEFLITQKHINELMVNVALAVYKYVRTIFNKYKSFK